MYHFHIFLYADAIWHQWDSKSVDAKWSHDSQLKIPPA